VYRLSVKHNAFVCVEKGKACVKGTSADSLCVVSVCVVFLERVRRDREWRMRTVKGKSMFGMCMCVSGVRVWKYE